MKRREFLGLLAAPVFGATPGEPSVQFPNAPRDRLAVASYPFRKDVDPQKGTLKLVDFPKMVVDRFQVKGIEPLDEHFPATDAIYLDKFRQALDKSGTHVVNIPVGRLHGSFYDPDKIKRTTAIETAKKWVDVAAAIASPGIRVHVQTVRGLKPDVDLAAASLKQVADYGQGKNIVVNLENDDPASEEAFYLADVMDRANTPWLRALPDFCNSMLLNKGDDYNYRAVTAMFQHACTISHVKEIETDEGKVYRVDLDKTFAIASKSGYKGYFSIEWDSDGDPYEGTAHLIAGALKVLS